MYISFVNKPLLWFLSLGTSNLSLLVATIVVSVYQVYVRLVFIYFLMS